MRACWWVAQGKVGVPTLIFSAGISNVIEEVRCGGLPGIMHSIIECVHELLAYALSLLHPTCSGPLLHQVFVQLGCPPLSAESRIVGNRMIFDAQGKLQAFADPLIHMCASLCRGVPLAMNAGHACI